jgi:hypothetical protein
MAEIFGKMRARDARRGGIWLALLLLVEGVFGGLVPRSAFASSPVAEPEVGPNVPVTLEDLANRAANNSPLLMADPTDERFVVLANRLDGPDFGCALQVSGNGGRGWLTVNPVPELPPGAEKCYAPEVAFDGQGLLYFLFLGLQGPGNSPMGAFLTTSRDHGATFSPPRPVLGPERYQVRMAIDPEVGRAGRIHLVWLETASDPPLGGLPDGRNPLMAAFSDDGGEHFSAPVQVSDPQRLRVVAPAVTLGPKGSVHVLYYDLEDDTRDYQGLEGPTWEGNWSLVLSSSSDGGPTFGPGILVDGGVVPPERVMLIFTMPPPSLASDGEGRLYASWYDARNGDWDVFLRRSADAGRTWSEPLRVNDDPMRNGSHQYLPRLGVAPGGRVDVAFYDRRGNKENRGNDVNYAYSDDGGATFSSNLKLTTIDSDSKVGPRYDVPSATGLNEFGSRIALWSSRSSALVAWTDTRNTGRASPAQDVFAATATFPGSSGRSWWLVVVGLPIAGALLLLFGMWRRRTAKPAPG